MLCAFRMLSPFRTKSIGIGTKTIAITPNIVLPQPSPSLAYKGTAASGRAAAHMFLKIVAAAVAEAANIPKASTR